MGINIDGLTLGMKGSSLDVRVADDHAVSRRISGDWVVFQFESVGSLERIAYLHKQDGIVYVKGFIAGIPGFGLVSCGFITQEVESTLGPPVKATTSQGRHFLLYEFGETTLRFESVDERISAIEMFLKGNKYSDLLVRPIRAEASNILHLSSKPSEKDQDIVGPSLVESE